MVNLPIVTIWSKDHLLTNNTILKDCQRGLANLPLVGIDYKKAHNIVPHD